MKQTRRPSWDCYFMEIAKLVATRSTCLRRNVGAVFVKDKHLLTTGYNGGPKNLAHCLDIGCMREKLKIPHGERHELCRGTHAEQNAIIQAAISGVNIANSLLYCTHHPCSLCVRMLINADIHTVYFLEGYPDDFARELAQEANMEIIQFSMEKDQ